MGKKRNHNRLPPFVALTWDMLNSDAYKSLTYSSAKALPYFLGKVKGGFNDPQRYLVEYPFSYSEGDRYGFACATFSKVIQELVAKGFVDPADKGGLRSDGKSYNLFRLSKRWMKFGTERFEAVDWRCFKPRMKTKSNFRIGKA